jgi:hypothetical protein
MSNQHDGLLPSRYQRIEQRREATMPGLARVLSMALADPAFGAALISDPAAALERYAHYRFVLNDAERSLLCQSGYDSLQSLAACIEQAQYP